jgi:hypothetical protein
MHHGARSVRNSHSRGTWARGERITQHMGMPGAPAQEIATLDMTPVIAIELGFCGLQPTAPGAIVGRRG